MLTLGMCLAAHPRVSGENVFYIAGVDMRRGSSPRERGKLITGVFKLFTAGLIPA